MRARRRRGRGRAVQLLIACILSVVGHLIAAGLLVASHRPRPPRPVARPIALRRFDARRWEKNRGNLERPAPKGQIVDVAVGNGRESPLARYVAETSNRVRKETRARDQVPKYSRATPKTSAAPEALPAARGSTGGRRTPAVSASSLFDRLTGAGGFRPRLAEPERRATPGDEESEREAKEPAGVEDAAPDLAAGDAALLGGGAPNDDLRDVEEGEGTYLNTREWRYASFFNRVKQAVSARWDPNGRLRAKGDRAFADRQTLLQVTLRPDGSLADCFVAKSSGLDYLDLEAVQAFERAQPFANPPAALVAGGYIRFTFSFTVTNVGWMPLR